MKKGRDKVIATSIGSCARGASNAAVGMQTVISAAKATSAAIYGTGFSAVARPATTVVHVPREMMQDLDSANAALVGKCFDNCVIAVLAFHRSNRLRYILGFLTPPGHDKVAHAWLQQDGESGPVYLDPTLQASSLLWNQRKRDFLYEQRFCYTGDELVKYFKEKYPDRDFSELGLPSGQVRGPIITDSGELA